MPFSPQYDPWINPSILSKRSPTVYTSSEVDATVTGANARLSMLPADVRTGLSYIVIPGGTLAPGSHMLLYGAGTIGARSVGTPGFNMIPWVMPVGGSKTDMVGFSYAPLLGTDGRCRILMGISQSQSGLRPFGFVDYGADNGQFYSIGINGGATGASGALPTITASDWTVDRQIGVDGFWGAGSDTREYVKCRSVTMVLFPAS